MISRPESLFSPELRDRADRLEQAYKQFVARLPQLADKDARLHPGNLADQKIADIREKLSQKRYRVGFLGTSQAGKSTTLNSYIDREKLLPQGNSMSCTSIRIRFFRNTDAEGYRVRFIYMTRAGYRLRRDDIAADLLKLYDRHAQPALNDDEVLSLLQKDAIADEDDIKVARLLERMVQAGKLHANWLGDNRKTEDVGVEKLTKDADVSALLQRSATHDGDGNPKWSLLEEIQLGIPGLELPDNVELVDLPGLSTTRGADDQYTMRAARELNGAVVVISVADNVARPEIYEIVKQLRKEFENDSSRVWIIGNKTDGVSRENLIGPSGTNIVDTIATVLKSHAIDPRHFLFTSNELYVSPLSSIDFLRPKGIQYDDSGRPILSSAFDSHHELKSAFLRLCDDGGIAALKSVINGTMEPAIRRGLNSQIDRSIVKLAQRLHSAVAGARRAAEAGSGGRAVARKWCGAIEQVIALVNHNVNDVQIDKSVAAAMEKDSLSELSRHVRGVMRSELNGTLRFAGPHETGTELKVRFADASDAMRREGESTFASEGGVQKYLNQIVDALSQASVEYPDPACIPKPVEYFRERLEAMFVEPWSARLSQDFDSLSDQVLIDDQGGIPVNLNEFRTIMQCKADQVVRQREYRYRNFVITQLRSMLDQLRDYAPPELEVVNLDTSVYDSMLEPLSKLCQPMSGEVESYQATQTSSVTDDLPARSFAPAVDPPAAKATEDVSVMTVDPNKIDATDAIKPASPKPEAAPQFSGPSARPPVLDEYEEDDDF